MQDEESEEDEEYFFEDEKKANKKKLDEETFNPKCRCPELTCPRHSNCKECQAFHKKRLEITYCGK
jgi:hypothetical protein